MHNKCDYMSHMNRYKIPFCIYSSCITKILLCWANIYVRYGQFGKDI